MLKAKRWAALALCLALCLSSGAVYATETTVRQNGEGGIGPYATYIRDKDCKLTLIGKTATARAWVEGQDSVVTKTEVVVELQEKSGSAWKTLDTWSDAQNGSQRATASGTYTATPGRTYRAVATVTAWSGRLYETMTLTSEEKTA